MILSTSWITELTIHVSCHPKYLGEGAKMPTSSFIFSTLETMSFILSISKRVGKRISKDDPTVAMGHWSGTLLGS